MGKCGEQDSSRRTFLTSGIALTAGICMQPVLGVSASKASSMISGDYPALNPAVLNERADLNIWLLPELAEHQAYRTAIELFERSYRQIRVSVTPVSKDDIPTRLKIAVASGGGNIPDFVSHHAYVFGAQGLAQECDFLWAAWGEQQSFLSSALSDVTWRLNTFGIPLVMNAVVAILSAELFQRAHVRLPDGSTTFSEFVEAVSAVKRATGTPYGMLLSADPTTVTAAVHANGGSLLRTEPLSGRNLQMLDDPRTIEAVRFYTEFGWRRHLAPIPSTSSNNTVFLAQLFAARRAPAFFGTLDDVSLIQAADRTLQLALSPLPGGTTGRTRGSVNDGASIVVIADPLLPQRHPHAAFELGKWLVARSPALAVAQSLHLAPTVAGYYRDRSFLKDRLAQTYFEVAQTARPILLDAYPSAFVLYSAAVRSCFGGEDARKSLTAVAREVQTAMDRADAGLDSDG